MVILVPEIHVFNFLLYCALSLIFRVKTYETKPFFHRFKRIELLNLSNYLSWEDCLIIKSDTVRIWEDVSKEAPFKKWKINVGGHNVDISLKAEQDLQKEIEKLLFLKNVIFRHRPKTHIITSLKFDFLSKMKKTEDISDYPTIKFISAVNILLDRFNLAFINFCYCNYVIGQFIFGLIYNKKTKNNIKYIYDSAHPWETPTDKDRIRLSWLIDDRIMREDEILHLIPKDKGYSLKEAYREKKDKYLLKAHLSRMNKFASRRALFSCIFSVLRMYLRSLAPGLGLESLMKQRYEISILKWVPIIKAFSPKVYICCSSKVGVEDPAVAYFNSLGMKTVMWGYSATGYFFISNKKPEGFKFRSLHWANIVSSVVVVWNRDFKKYIEDHPQGNLEIKVMGPLMFGDEDVMKFDKGLLYARLNLNHVPNAKTIAVFDAPPPPVDHKFNYALQPRFNSENYNYAFLRDAYRLLSDFPDIVLIYKQKRKSVNNKVFRSDEFRKLFNEMRQDPRVIIMDHDVNPWIPIALSDMSISMSFTSPTIAALHYGKPAIFHDPTNTVRHHRYDKIKNLITNGFSELEELVEKLLFNAMYFKKLSDNLDISDFVGVEPGTNSSRKFSEFLESLTKD